MNFKSKQLKNALITVLLTVSCPVWADCRCDDGTIFRGGNGECRDGSICHLIAEEVTRFKAEEVTPFRAEEVTPSGQKNIRPQTDQVQHDPGTYAKEASICGKLPQNSQSEFLYRCNDGSIQETNDCPDGNMGHLFKADSIVCKQHDPNYPNRIALSEFMGKWNTWVPGAAYSVDDYVNGVRVHHTSPGSAPHRDLVIYPNRTYVWKGIRGTWGTTNDDENPIVLYRAVDGHDWQVSILENWYGYLALSDATNTGIYYHGKR